MSARRHKQDRQKQTQLAQRSPAAGEYLIQPEIDFVYEVSFYFINDTFEYAMYAPDKSKRWELKMYESSDADALAQA